MKNNIVVKYGSMFEIEYLEGHEPTIEQIEWLKELHMKEYLAKPFNERVKIQVTNQEELAWMYKDYHDMGLLMEEGFETAQEVEEYTLSLEAEEAEETNSADESADEAV